MGQAGTGDGSEKINIGKHREVKKTASSNISDLINETNPCGHQVRDCFLSSAVSSLGERAEAETLQPGEDHDQQQQRHHAGPAQPQQQLRGGVRAELLSCPGETKHTAGAQ